MEPPMLVVPSVTPFALKCHYFQHSVPLSPQSQLRPLCPQFIQHFWPSHVEPVATTSLYHVTGLSTAEHWQCPRRLGEVNVDRALALSILIVQSSLYKGLWGTVRRSDRGKEQRGALQAVWIFMDKEGRRGPENMGSQASREDTRRQPGEMARLLHNPSEGTRTGGVTCQRQQRRLS